YDSLLAEGFNQLTFNNPTMAIKFFKKAHKISKSAEVYAGLGLAYNKKVQDVFKKSKDNQNQFQALRAVKNNKSAIEFFERSIELDPTDLNCKYNLARAYTYRGDPESLQKAVKIFEELKGQQSSYIDIDLELARIYRALNQPNKSEAILQDFLDVGTDSSKGLYEITKLFSSRNDFERASYYYLLTLESAAEEDEVGDLFDNVKLLFTPRDRAEFENSDHKGDFVKRFWRLIDPTPLTAENEVLIEHLKRVAYAEVIFKSKDPNEVYDERGEAHIKYGEPDFRYQSPGDAITYSNESWVYEKRLSERGGQLFYDFVDSGFGFKIVRDLRQALMRGTSDYSQFVVLYQDRDYIYPELYQRVWEKFYTDQTGTGFFSVDTELERIEEIKNFNERDYPPTFFDFDYGGDIPFNAVFVSACFKGREGNSRVEMYYAFPLDEIYFEPDRASSTMNTIVNREIAVRNIDLEYLYADNTDIEVKMELTYDVTGRISIGQINFEISPTEIEPVANLKFKSDITNSVGLYYYDLEVRDFRGSDFMLSDIQFSDNISSTETYDQFTKNGLRIIPHISEVVHKDIPLYVYFEIYNLKRDRGGDAKYRVEYIVSRRGIESIDEIRQKDTLRVKLPESLAREENYIAMSDDYIKKVNNTYEFRAFDLGALANGNYVFSVRVYDKEAEVSSVSKKNFTLKD
ncbi:GWxTD domain-containing protein, partial [candidate division KSB1 bacterium]